MEANMLRTWMCDKFSQAKSTCALILRFVTLHRRAQMAYPASFYMLTVSHFLGIAIEMLAILALFNRFGQLAGWSWNHLAILYGIMHMSFATAELSGRGFDTFSQIVRTGDFDRVLLRPYSPFLQVALREFQFMRLGRFIQGALVLIWGASTSHLISSDISLGTVVGLLFCCYVGTSCLFYGLFVIQATIAFWTIESLEMMHITTYGGLEAGQFPMSLYPQSLRIFFMWIIPVGSTTYLPIAMLTGYMPFFAPIAFLLPLLGVGFLLLSVCFWQLGVRHYSSTGH